MDSKICISGFFPQEICSILDIQPAFRGRQIFQWISRGGASFQDMTNLDKSLRERLEERASIYSSSVTDILRDRDGTIKLQITLEDGRAIETVLLTDREGRKTACVSCQAGCGMGCKFCQTGRLGFGRNLNAGEIVQEFLMMEKEAGKLDNIVFMGMGEPMQNLGEIRKAIEILSSRDGRNLSTRRITLSTCGLIKGIYELADKGPSIRLAVSLTTADPQLREELMPVTKANPLPELKEAIKYYSDKTGMRVTLEAALLSGVNTGRESARRLIEFARDLDAYINLIPWNPVEGLPFTSPSGSECRGFVSMLEEAGLNVNLRTRRGRDIGGACGQLGRSTTERQQTTI